MDEHWLPITGYEGVYEVSDQGRVRSLPRMRWGGGGMKIRFRFLKPSPSKAGYPRVNLFREGKPTMYYIHHLVMTTFVGPCPADQEVCHNEGDPADNRLEHLRYDTHAGNMRDMMRHGTGRGQFQKAAS